MKGTTYEATIENGHVILPKGVRLPERARVYVVVPDAGEIGNFRIMSPRLADSQRASDFAMEVTPEVVDAEV